MAGAGSYLNKGGGAIEGLGQSDTGLNRLLTEREFNGLGTGAGYNTYLNKYGY
jgi:hypothetical protein